MSNVTTKRDRKDDARAKAAAFRESERRRARRRLVVIVAVAAGLVVVLAAVIVLAVVNAPVPVGPEGMALEQGTVLAKDTTSSAGATEGGVQCSADEQTSYHIHTHLAVYVNGQLRPIPPGIGIVPPVAEQTAHGAFYGATRCYYWLHVHAQDGVIHVESPTTDTYTLGQFFAVWQQPLSATDVAGATGTVTAFVNGKKVSGDPSSIRLGSREDIQLDIGTVVPFRKVDWSQSKL